MRTQYSMSKNKNKKKYTIPKAYRPVSLLNCLGKKSENIVASRLAYLAENHHLLHQWQIGGRTNRSAIDACMLVSTTIDNARHKNKTVSSLCMDVKGAFDNLYLQRLLYTLIDKDLPLPLRRWVENSLSNRTACLSFDGQIGEMSPIHIGIPQGSPVSIILFLLYLSPLFDFLEKNYPDTTCPIYIDDIALLVTGKTDVENHRTLEKMAKTAVDCGASNVLLFDNPKTELTHFHNKRTTKPTATVTMPDGNIIKTKDIQRWLGIKFDRKLSFKQHVQIKSTSAMKTFTAIS